MSTAFPVSDHCDGRRFFNPDGDEPRSARDLLRWWRTRRVEPWPADLPAAMADPPRATGPDEIAVTWIGHSTLLLHANGRAVLTDPVFTRHAGPFGRVGPRRVRPPALAIAGLPPIDLVVVSHNHYDHLQPSNLRALQARFAPAFVTTLGNRRLLEKLGLRRVSELDWWETAEAAGMEVVCTPARHFSARSPFDRNRTLWGGFAVRTGRRTLYFTGDTGYSPLFREVGRRVPEIEVACVPIGAYDPRWFMRPVHVDPEEAVQIHLDVGARRSIGMHFGTFRLTDEAFDEPPRRLIAAREAAGLAPEAFHVPAAGETVRIRV
jgi:L-ascorbate metabolism protein UlaG (beta-lactamase superfamily)